MYRRIKLVKRDLISNIIIFIAVLITFIFFRVFLFTTYQVLGVEANSFLQEKDHLLISKLKKPSYKDFVLYEAEGKSYLGRVVALPGDTAAYLDDIFYLNDQVDNEDYLDEMKEIDRDIYSVDKPYTEDFTLDNISQKSLTKIPEKEYLILNDNRRDKNDSRQFGLISSDQIEGVVTFKLFPLEEFGFIDVE